MSAIDLFNIILLSVMLCALGYWFFFVEGRYLLRVHRSRSWPAADAVITPGAIGRVSTGNTFSPGYGCFLGYAFDVSGVRYYGQFVIFGDPDTKVRLQRELPGKPVRIHYMPSNPNISFLENKFDSRFGSWGAKQDPRWLDQAPMPDLTEAMRRL